MISSSPLSGIISIVVVLIVLAGLMVISVDARAARAVKEPTWKTLNQKQ